MASPSRDIFTSEDNEFSRDMLNGSLGYSPDRPLKQGTAFQAYASTTNSLYRRLIHKIRAGFLSLTFWKRKQTNEPLGYSYFQDSF